MLMRSLSKSAACLNARYCNNRANNKSRSSNSAISSVATAIPDGSKRAVFNSSRVAATTINEVEFSKTSSVVSNVATYAKNSSVTSASATSVTSMRRRAINDSSRSNGPEKLVSASSKPTCSSVYSSSKVGTASWLMERHRGRSVLEQVAGSFWHQDDWAQRL